MSEPTSLTSPSILTIALAVLCVSFCVQSAVAQDGGETLSKRRQRLQDFQDPLYEDFDDARAEFRKTSSRKFLTVMNNGIKVGLDNGRLEEGVDHKLKMLTDTQLSREQLQEETRDVIKILNSSGRLLAGGKKTKFRERVFEFALKRVDTLLLKNNYACRISAINIMGGLNAQERPLVPYCKSAKRLLAIASNEEELPEFRGLAFMALNRMVKFGGKKFARADELAVLDALSKALAADNPQMDRESANAFYILLSLCLENVKLDTNAGGTPVGMQALATSMQARGGLGGMPPRSFQVRAAAARALANTGTGQPPVNYKPIAYGVAQLAIEMGNEYNRQMGMRPFPRDGIKFPNIVDLLLAFTGPDGKGGMRSRAGEDPLVKEAYKILIEIVRPTIGGKKIPNKPLADLSAWLQKNKPASMKYHPKAPPLSGPGENGNQ